MGRLFCFGSNSLYINYLVPVLFFVSEPDNSRKSIAANISRLLVFP